MSAALDLVATFYICRSQLLVLAASCDLLCALSFPSFAFACPALPFPYRLLPSPYGLLPSAFPLWPSALPCSLLLDATKTLSGRLA